MSLKEIAKQTMAIVAEGGYEAPSGERLDLRSAIDGAVRGTRLYRPEELSSLLGRSRAAGAAPPVIEVTAETTGSAARRLANLGVGSVTALNFASAKNPGGGFLTGAKAQEEDLARCSALYACLVSQRDYYEANRACDSMLYTDHIIYSPSVPFFRDDGLRLLERPFVCSIITAPAPNAGQLLLRDPGSGPDIERTLRARAGVVLATAQAENQRNLVLGAWGCGVFRNRPEQVAAVFKDSLLGSFRGAFDRVTFAVYDRSRDASNLAAFRREFGGHDA
jgi:uncharacterized protein (TIGR02452 family)